MRDSDDSQIDEIRHGRMSRRDLVRRLVVGGVSLSAISGLTRAGAAGETAVPVEAASVRPRRGGTLHVAAFEPLSLRPDPDPVTMVDMGTITAAQLAGEYLCFPRPDYSLQPRLATSWHATRPDVWTFTLRQGVKWHDSSPFTADDVVATFDRLTDPHAGSNALVQFSGILSKGNTRKVDAHRVTFHLDRPYANFPYLVSAFNWNTIILPRTYTIGSFKRGGIGTGPYILRTYTHQRGGTYVKNRHYWRHGLPYLDGIDLTYYPDNAAIGLAMEAGAVDVHPNVPHLGSQALLGNPAVQILTNPSSTYRELSMRVDRKPFTDRRVRQAIALCLNRPQIVRSVLRGQGQVGNDHPFAPIYPDSVAATEEMPVRTTDYATARRLLADAGYPNGLSLTLTTEAYLEIPQYAGSVKDQLKPAGIKLELNIEDQARFYGAGPDQPWLTVPMGLVDWAARANASQTIVLAYRCGALWNAPHWCNPQFEHLMTEYDRELNSGRRRQLVVQAARLFRQEVPAIIAYWLDELRAVRPNVHGLPRGPATCLDPSTFWRSS